MDIALDLGTANARLRVNNNENAIDQPSVIAYNKDDKLILAVGDEAYEMLGRTSAKINVVFPLQGGPQINTPLSGSITDNISSLHPITSSDTRKLSVVIFLILVMPFSPSTAVPLTPTRIPFFIVMNPRFSSFCRA